MPGRTLSEELSEVVEAARAKILKYRSNRGFNEQNTKASLIVPVLQALGWDTNDPDEVHWEYKPKPKYNPVDFALLLQRTPCLLLEAKALRESLADDKLTAQILTYASVSGVQWVVLSNGDEYRIYNASAPLPIEEKLFRAIALSSSDMNTAVATLSLLSKRDLQDKKITRLWESHFVDRQVKAGMEVLLNPEEPARVIVRAIAKLSDGRLRETDVRASLRRVRLQFDFPAEPETTATVPEPRKKTGAVSTGGGRSRESASGQPRSGVTLEMLIQDGLLKPPANLVSRYLGHDLAAVVEQTGKVRVGGTLIDSLSVAGGMARNPYYKGELKWGRCPPTNGWTFWSIHDRESGKPVPMAVLRDRYLKKRATQTDRFQKGVV